MIFTAIVNLVHHAADIWRAGWTIETCSCILALLSLSGMIATLWKHQDQPLPAWPQIMSINAIVSLFSLIMRAAIGVVVAEGISQSKWQWYRRARRLDDLQRFDAASRGISGSVLLLLNFRLNRPYFVAALGALITLMASLSGFTSQQLIRFESCLQRDPSASATVLKANRFAGRGEEMSSSPFRWTDYAPMSAAIQAVMFQSSQDYTATLSKGCSTGNCTFPSFQGAAFSTVAITHSCEDVTDMVRATPAFAIEDYQNGTIIRTPRTYKLLNGTEVQAVKLNLTTISGGDLYQMTGTSDNFDDNFATTYDDYVDKLGSIVLLVKPDEDRFWEYLAVRCSFSPSVNTYAVTIKNAVLEENLIESTPIGTNIWWTWGGHSGGADTLWDRWQYKLARNSTLRNGTPTECRGGELDRNTEVQDFITTVAPINIEFAPSVEMTSDPKNLKDRQSYPQDCVWGIHEGSIAGINLQLQRLFANQSIQGNRPGPETPTHLRQLFAEGNITLATVNEFMARLSTAMTNVMRIHGDEDPSAYVNGTILYSTTCLRITWLWITFPTTMIGSVFIFLVFVCMENRSVPRDRLWKSSILAVLFCEVDVPAINGSRTLTRRDMEEVAGSTSVSLDKTNDTLRLISR
ncbi:hypothetical protein BU25DRAFT_428322 [Macroventuria anomochaeta]|uniref:Uncharacterized protein n=1 Tax=Macroventuria anomochaeta TaxID=301207 RepID=A0ACB6SB35_9PLEO|nr:uncharacterized protein BU25DRAFT_428322 [Macroventuria anomochaeta]KAF2631346.1 hypothetical protein BU25DRAFT_428322 [Macroventuria anomochaeta]